MFKKTIFILFAGLFFIFGCEEQKPAPQKDKTPIKQSLIYYFHGNIRCASCHKIETYTKEVFEENFKDSLDFKAINVDLLENGHFIEKYQLVSKSVVLVKIEDGKEVAYKNLNKIWQKLRNKESFKDYLKSEIEGFFNEEVQNKNDLSSLLNDDIQIYHFYHKPYGITCKKAESLIKQFISSNSSGGKLELVDVSKTNPEQFVKNYTSREKAVVIMNKKNNKFAVSSIRTLIKQGKSDEEIKNSFFYELKSIL